MCGIPYHLYFRLQNYNKYVSIVLANFKGVNTITGEVFKNLTTNCLQPISISILEITNCSFFFPFGEHTKKTSVNFQVSNPFNSCF